MTAPLRFALVPVEPNSAQLREMRLGDQTNNRPTYAAVLAASPGNDLLERIVSVLNDASIDLWGKGMNTTARKVDAILDEFGGGHG